MDNLGSPPHTRGKVSISKKALPLIRITPAYAGKSEQGYIVKNPYQDHPRIRGEKRFDLV